MSGDQSIDLLSFSSKPELFTIAITRMMAMGMQQTTLRLEEPGTLKERLINVAAAKMQQSHVDTETMMREAGSVPEC